MTTGLIWLQNAGWGGQKPWRSPSNYDDVYMRAGILYGGTPDAGLSDGSQTGDWRMPTLSELVAITEGTEPISLSAMYFSPMCSLSTGLAVRMGGVIPTSA